MYKRQVQFQLAQKIQATRALFHDMFINGDSGTQANQFDGIDKAIAGSSTEIIPSAAIDVYKRQQGNSADWNGDTGREWEYVYQ